MSGYSYWNKEHYFYHNEILDLIQTIKIERNARRDNGLKLTTSLIEDFIKALGQIPVE